MSLNLLPIIIVIAGLLVCVFFVYSCFVISSLCSQEEEQNNLNNDIHDEK